MQLFPRLLPEYRFCRYASKHCLFKNLCKKGTDLRSYGKLTDCESNIPIIKLAQNKNRNVCRDLFQACQNPATCTARMGQPVEAALMGTSRGLLGQTNIPEWEPQKWVRWRHVVFTPRLYLSTRVAVLVGFIHRVPPMPKYIPANTSSMTAQSSKRQWPLK